MSDLGRYVDDLYGLPPEPKRKRSKRKLPAPPRMSPVDQEIRTEFKRKKRRERALHKATIARARDILCARRKAARRARKEAA